MGSTADADVNIIDRCCFAEGQLDFRIPAIGRAVEPSHAVMPHFRRRARSMAHAPHNVLAVKLGMNFLVAYSVPQPRAD